MRLRSVWIAASKGRPIFTSSVAVAMVLAIGLFVFAAGPTQASGLVVKGIEVEGTKRLSVDATLYYIKIRPGDVFSPTVLSEQIKDLYSLGFFEDIRVYSRLEDGGIILIFRVVERPIVGAIRTTGNDEIKGATISKKITCELKKPLDKAKLAESVDAIRRLYVEKGYAYAKITPEVHKVSPSSVELVFQIEERAKVKVSDIIITGNESLSSFKLKGQIATRERFLKHPFTGVRFFFSDLGKYEPDKLELDRLLLERFYKHHGYLEVKVSEPNVEFSEERKGLIVRFNIDEGKHYKVGSVRIEGNTVIPTEKIETDLEHIALPGKMRFGFFRANERELTPGSDYSLGVEETAVGGIRADYTNKGYLNSRVEVSHVLNKENGTVDITLLVLEDEQYRLGQLSFSGNTRTRDKVLRREFRLVEGDIFDMSKFQRSISKIQNLGFIEPDVRPDVDLDTKTKTADVNVKVKEGRLHEFRFQASYGKYQRFGIGGSIVEHNFLGYGQTFGISGSVSDKTQTYELNFNEPYFLDTNYSFGAGLYNHKMEYQWYTKESAGGRITLGRKLSEYIHISNTYRLENVQITDIAEYEFRPNNWDIHWDPGVDADQRLAPLESDLQYEEETSLTSSDAVSIWWDSRDNWMKPTRGLHALASGRLAGVVFGGDRDFYKLKGELAYHYPLLERLIFTTRNRIEYGDGIGGDELPLFERYYLGGAMLGGRGFDSYELGPKDRHGNSAGGNKSMLFCNEIFYILADPIHLGVFWDAGQVYSEGEDFDLERLRTSYGVELRIFVPMFIYPIRLVYGIKRKPLEDEDKTNFDFAIGLGF